MLFQGQAISVSQLDAGIYDLVFDCQDDVVNKLDPSKLEELGQALALIKQQPDLQGLMLSSAKSTFISGADVTQFMVLFRASEDDIAAALQSMHQVFNTLEDMPCPTVSAINGMALGGGFEICLATDYRVADQSARVGQPEIKLGIFPGWGGTVRLPRVIGADNANEWICTGKEKTADEALSVGAIDAVVSTEMLKDTALDLLKGCIKGDFDYQGRRTDKTTPLTLPALEIILAYESAKAVIHQQAGPHYPAPLAVLKTMHKSVFAAREQAQLIEAQGFAKVAKTDVCAAMVGLFMKDHHVRSLMKFHEKQAHSVEDMAVLGAGIMGGGIAYQAACSGMSVVLKDISQTALKLGLAEAGKLLASQVKRGRIDQQDLVETLSRITPTQCDHGLAEMDLVVEAVVENVAMKQSVLADVESVLTDDAVLASNTSTISIDTLAEGLKRPENFCGMHFFNPVHRMPLVEVVRGSHSSEQAVATVVKAAHKMGKTPIVVNDCPGFLVNRILLPYFSAFNQLLADGADFIQVDRCMEKYGWPMGPAYLLDVVGIDTAFHAAEVMAEGFPDRMVLPSDNAISRMYQQERYGQKNGHGFYRYELDKKGKPNKQIDKDAVKVLFGFSSSENEFQAVEVIERMMIPLCIESARCLEEGIVSSAAELDMGLVLGIGFPPFKGGALHYMDGIGLSNFCEMAERYAHLGPLYQPTEKMQQMASTGESYFAWSKGE
mgnify:CR=1 FL=1